MIVLATIVNGPITREVEATARIGANVPRDGTIGSLVRFEGIVRLLQNGRELRGLDYQTYDPMAQRELESLARVVGTQFGLDAVLAIHSRGLVKVGEVSFVLEVASPHRAEGIAGLTAFIDRLKQDVPIWKRAAWKM